MIKDANFRANGNINMFKCWRTRWNEELGSKWLKNQRHMEKNQVREIGGINKKCSNMVPADRMWSKRLYLCESTMNDHKKCETQETKKVVVRRARSEEASFRVVRDLYTLQNERMRPEHTR